MHDLICATLAGQVAEEVVFGQSSATGGGTGDISKATATAVQMIRWNGMSDWSSRVGSENVNTSDSPCLNYDVDATNALIEKVIKEQKARAKQMIDSNLPLMKAISSAMLKEGKLEPQRFQDIFKQFGVDIAILDVKSIFCNGYREKFDDFLKGE